MYESNIWKMYIFRFLKQFFFVSGVLVPFFMDWGQISYMQIMILQFCFMGFIFILEVPTGAFADRFGRKASLAASGLILTIAALTYASTPNFYIFILAEFLFALSVAFFSGADQAMLYDSLKLMDREKEAKIVFGKAQSFATGALIIAAPIGSIIAATIGLRYTMMLVSVPAFMGFLLALTLKEPASDSDIKEDYLKVIKDGASYFRNHKVVKAMVADSISITVLSFMIIWTYQKVLLSLDVDIAYYGFVHAAMCVLQVIILNNFNSLERIFGSAGRYLKVSALITGIFMLMLAFSASAWLAVLCIVLVAGFGLTRETLYHSYMNHHIESKRRATVMSFVSMIQRGIIGITYVFVGLLDMISIQFVILMLGAIMLASRFFIRINDQHLQAQ